MDNDFAFYCPRCQHGRCYSGRATFARVIHGKMISAPDTPAFICDVCGYNEFEYGALMALTQLLGDETKGREADGNSPASYSVDESGDPGESRHPKT